MSERGAAAALVALLLAGCSLAPHYERPSTAVPAGWNAAEEEVARSDEPSAAAGMDWQAFITDANLRGLVRRALDDNRDLRQALLDVEAARAQYRIQRADRVPGIDAQVSSARQRLPGDVNGTGRAAIQQTWQAGAGLTAFELDLFGRVRNLSRSALREYLATEEAARGARISLVAEVIRAYVARESALQRYELAGDAWHSREESLQLIVQRRRAGAADELDYQEALGLLEQARVDQERADREARQAGNALVLLVGADLPRDELPRTAGFDHLLVQDIAAGAPAQLLTQRPDIRAAEHRLLARNADIGVARAAFLPRISLTAFLGSASAELDDLFSGGQGAWSFTPQLTLPIFAAGRNRASLDLANVRKDAAVAAYEQSIQAAFREVSDALAAIDTLRREEAARRQVAKAGGEALRLAEARYRAGLDDHLRYLDAQRADFANRSALIDTSAQRQAALADLFKALGGGWPDGVD